MPLHIAFKLVDGRALQQQVPLVAQGTRVTAQAQMDCKCTWLTYSGLGLKPACAS